MTQKRPATKTEKRAAARAQAVRSAKRHKGIGSCRMSDRESLQNKASEVVAAEGSRDLNGEEILPFLSPEFEYEREGKLLCCLMSSEKNDSAFTSLMERKSNQLCVT